MESGNLGLLTKRELLCKCYAIVSQQRLIGSSSSIDIWQLRGEKAISILILMVMISEQVPLSEGNRGDYRLGNVRFCLAKCASCTGATRIPRVPSMALIECPES